MFTSALEITWTLLPAIAANMAPVFAPHHNHFPALNRPLDGGKKWQNKPLLGHNKTIRGLIVGLAAAASTALIQHMLTSYPAIQSITLINYQSLTHAALIGILLGAGALVGDATKSFIKRRLNRAPGALWVPFDEIDFIIGALIVVHLLTPLTSSHIILALIVIGVGSYLASRVGVTLHIKRSL